MSRGLWLGFLFAFTLLAGACLEPVKECAPLRCDTGLCGDHPDGCGGTVHCGPCTCVPKTCEPGACGDRADGCGGTLHCGACPCVPTTCAAQGVSCGSLSDGCGGTLQCGDCALPATCGGGGRPGACGCATESDTAFCTRVGSDCGSTSGVDRCGVQRMVACGTCKSPSTCGGGGTPHVCGCSPETDASMCQRLQAECGMRAGLDNCGAPRTVWCGDCAAPQTCGGAGQRNVCGCLPETDTELCALQGQHCGPLSVTDRCGALRQITSCGGCTFPQTCGGGGAPGACGCSALTCSGLGWTCGTTSDGCGGTLTCGTCATGETCTDHACVCPGSTCGTACVDLQTDRNNCGACGVACALIDTCAGGHCCAPSQVFCAATGSCHDLLTDSLNCGTCGRDCDGAACVDGVCRPTVLATNQAGSYGIALEGPHVYWTNRSAGASGTGQVMRATLDGGDRVEVAGGQAMPMSLVVEPASLFWINTGYTWQPMRLDRDGGTPQALASSSPYFARGSLVLTGTDVLWGASSGSSGGAIYSVPRAGGARSTFYAAPPNAEPVAMARDDSSLYWTTQYTHQIMKASLQGQDAGPLVTVGTATDIAVDDTSVYWIEATNPGVYLKRVAKTGGAIVTLYGDPLPHQPVGPCGLVVDGPYVYFGLDVSPGRILKVPTTGGPAFVVAEGFSGVYQLAVDATHVYWTTFDSVMKAPK